MISLGPALRFFLDWQEMRGFSYEELPEIESSGLRGFDWVVWDDVDGQITASYVFPRKFGDLPGIEEGDILYQLNYQQYFQAATLNEVIQNLSPGETVTYSVLRAAESQDIDVVLKPYPTLMYPLSDFLWGASMWGFLLALFIHLIAIILATPLAFKSRGGWYASAMVLASGVWILTSVIRIGIINFAPSEFLLNSGASSIFNSLTVIGLGGWLLFPALLAKIVLHDQPYRSLLSRLGNILIFLPGGILFGLAIITGILGTVGPISIDHLIAPILFYVCSYVGGSLLAYLLFRVSEEEGAWSKGWSVFVIIISIIGAIIALGVRPIVDNISTVTTAWVILIVQLLGVAPILLISFATLRYGKLGTVLTQVTTRLTAFVTIFFLYIACLFLWQRYFGFELITQTILGAVLAVGMIPVYNRIVSRIEGYISQFLFTQRQKGRQKLSRFSREIINIPSKQDLVDRTIIEIGESLSVSSAVIYLKDDQADTGWLKANYRPSFPYITEEIVERTWPYFEKSPELWARNGELNESNIDSEISKLLQQSDVHLAVPITDQDSLTGIVILGERINGATVYNLEDVDLLQTVSNQVAVAVDRQRLFQREKELARQTSQAELAALRAQINPHFLFNTLNAISSLIEEKPEEAVRTVDNLSSIFRYTLNTGGAAFASLENEIRLVKKYLSIEKVRFGDRLNVTWDHEKELDSVMIPALALQTIVENSIVHGISKVRSDGQLKITTRKSVDFAAELIVEDNGPGIAEIANQGEVSGKQNFFGLGTTNVFTRLRELYGQENLLLFETEPGKGCKVRLLVPRETQSEDFETTTQD